MESSTGSHAARYSRATLASEVAVARRLLEAAGITLADQIGIGTDDLALRDGVESTLIVALRELAANIIQHSGATRAIVRAWRTDDYPAVVLDVMDDGRGFAGTLDGAGLRTVRERVEAVSGRMATGAAAGDRGMRITIMLPLEVERAPQAPVRQPRNSRDFEVVGA